MHNENEMLSIGCDAEVSAVTSHRQWASVGAVTLGTFAFVTTEFLPVGLIPFIAKDFNIPAGLTGLMVTIPAILAAVSAIALTMSVGRLDRRYLLLLLSASLFASNLLSALAPNFTALLLGRAILGVGLGGFWTLAIASAARLVEPPDVAKAMAIILAGVSSATVIGVPLGTFIANSMSWRASFFAICALVAVAFFAQLMTIPALPSRASLKAGTLLDLLHRPFVRRTMAMVFLGFGAHFSTYTYLSPFMLHTAGFTTESLTWILLGFGTIGLFSNFAFSTFVVARLKESMFAIFVMFATALLVLANLNLPPVKLVLVLALWGIAMGALPLCVSLWLQRATPDSPEAGSAIFMSIVQIGIAVGSWIGGAIVDSLGIHTVFGFGGLLALLALAALLTFSRLEAPSEANQHAAEALS